MEFIKTSAENIGLIYTIQHNGSMSNDNLWNTVETYTWCTDDFKEVAKLVRKNEYIVCMICEIWDDDEVGDCLTATYIETAE